MKKVPSANQKNPTDSSLVKIGQAAKVLGVSVKTLRRWEATGRLRSLRTPGGTRLYSTASLKRVYLQKKAELPSQITIHSWYKLLVVSSMVALATISTITAGYFTFPRLTSSLTRGQSFLAQPAISKNQGQTGEVLGIKQDVSNILGTIVAIALAPFNLISEKFIQTTSPQYAKQIGLYQTATEDRLSSNEKAISQTNQKLNTLTENLSSTSAQLSDQISTTSTNLQVYEDQIRNRVITNDVFIGESVIDSYGNVYPARTIAHSGLRSSVGTPNNRFFGIYANRFTLDTGGNLKVFGQTTLGDSPVDHIKLIGRLSNDLIPSGNGEISLGNGDKYFKKAYINNITADTGGFTSLSVGNLTASNNSTLPVTGDLIADNVISSTTVRDFILYNGTSPERGEQPVLLKLQNGTYLAIFRIGSSHASDNGRLVAYSSTNGKTWTSKSTVADDSTYDDRNASAVQLSNGTIVVGYITYNFSSGTTVDMKVVKSTDNGATWSSPTSQSNTHSPYADMIELSGGNILMPAYGRISGDTFDRSMIYRSTDGGSTFSRYSTIASNQTEDINEAGITKLSNGNIVAAIRTDQNGSTKMFFQTSTDNGATWDAINGLTTITGNSPELIQMPSDRLYLFVRYVAQYPHATAYYVSADNGSTWSGPHLIKYVSPLGSGGGAYPSAVAFNDSTIMVIYYDTITFDINETLLGDWPYTSPNIGARVAGPAIFGGGIMAGTDDSSNLILNPSQKIYISNNKTLGFLRTSGTGDGLQITVDTSNNANISTAGGNSLFLMSDDGGMYFQTYSGSWTTRMTVTDAGNVGIGTSLPSALFQVNTNTSNPFVVTSGGNVGIGTTSPSTKLQIVGGNCSDDAGGGGCTADYAEYYPASEDVEKADLLVIDTTNLLPNTVKRSSKSYQKEIMGIVSTAPAMIVEGSKIEFMNNEYQLDSRKPAVALSGRVPVKVSLENGPIEVGDYLTSSSTPGVAMKALRPGPVVGKALEEFPADTSEVGFVPKDVFSSEVKLGKILAFVNVSYADPGNFLASLSLDDQGNLIIPKIKVGSLTIDSSVIEDSNLSIEDGNIALSSTVDPKYSTLNSQSSTVQYYDLSGKIASLEERIKQLEDTLDAKVPTAVSSLVSTEATDSATLASFDPPPELDLTPPDILLATPSAILASSFEVSDATVSGMLAAYQAEIQDNFKVFGNTTLGNTLIAGDLTVDGTLSLSGNSINALSILYLQNNPLSSLIDIFNGKVTIDKEGNIKTAGEIAGASIVTNRLIISNQPIASSSAQISPTIGTGKILTGQISAVITSSQVSSTSKIFITPRSKIGSQALVVEEVKDKESFKVSLDHALPEDLQFDWWIVESK